MTGRRRYYPPTLGDAPMHGWRPYSDVHLERVRAHAKHDGAGDSMERKAYDDPAWLSVRVEEVGEVAQALCDFFHQGEVTDERAFMDHLREELVQVAAMSVAWIDAIDLMLCGATHERSAADAAFRQPQDPELAECARPLGHDGNHQSWSGLTRWSS